MSITPEELLELENLLILQEREELKESLINPGEEANPNYRLLHSCVIGQKYGLDSDGKKVLTEGVRGAALEGSSGAGKTWAGVDLIIWLCTEHDPGCTINIYRQFFAEFATTLNEDFKNRLDHFGLPNKFHNAEIVKSFKIGESKVSFIGCDKVSGKHGARADYAFFNEVMHIDDAVFKQVTMRCRKFWWADYNPSFTSHWFFDKVTTRKDVAFLRTTFEDNKHQPETSRSEILGYEPWEPGSYEVDLLNGTIYYDWEPVDETNQPPPHTKNVEQGTADEFEWRVYGLGLRGAMKGVIFKNVYYIDEFPDIAYTYGLDFGFTADPTCLVKYAETKYDIFMEYLMYKPTDTAEEVDEYFKAIGIERDVPITADSADRYVSEKKGVVRMVSALRDKGWLISKVRKTKNIMYWLGSMKRKRVHVVKNNFVLKAKKEFENYKLKEINGVSINQPIDGHDHGISAGRYGHMAHNNYKGDSLKIEVR